MADISKIADQLVELTVKEVSELLGVLKEKHGIEPAAAAVAVTGVPAPEDFLARLDECRPGDDRLGQHLIDLLFRRDIVRQREAGKAAALGRHRYAY